MTKIVNVNGEYKKYVKGDYSKFSNEDIIYNAEVVDNKGTLLHSEKVEKFVSLNEIFLLVGWKNLDGKEIYEARIGEEIIFYIQMKNDFVKLGCKGEKVSIELLESNRILKDSRILNKVGALDNNGYAQFKITLDWSLHEKLNFWEGGELELKAKCQYYGSKKTEGKSFTQFLPKIRDHYLKVYISDRALFLNPLYKERGLVLPEILDDNGNIVLFSIAILNEAKGKRSIEYFKQFRFRVIDQTIIKDNKTIRTITKELVNKNTNSTEIKKTIKTVVESDFLIIKGAKTIIDIETKELKRRMKLSELVRSEGSLMAIKGLNKMADVLNFINLGSDIFDNLSTEKTISAENITDIMFLVSNNSALLPLSVILSTAKWLNQQLIDESNKVLKNDFVTKLEKLKLNVNSENSANYWPNIKNLIENYGKPYNYYVKDVCQIVLDELILGKYKNITEMTNKNDNEIFDNKQERRYHLIYRKVYDALSKQTLEIVDTIIVKI